MKPAGRHATASSTAGRRRGFVHRYGSRRPRTVCVADSEGVARPLRPLPTALGFEFSVAQARAAGVGASRLRASDLARPFHGTRMRSRAVEPSTFDESPTAREARVLRDEIVRRARAVATTARPGWLFSHATAAVLWGLPVPLRVLRECVDAIDVAALGAQRAPRGRGVRGRQLLPELTSVRHLDGIPLASPASVWAQLGSVLSVEELIELGDAIVWIPRRRGIQRGTPADARGTIDQLGAALGAGRREGAGRLRDALPRIRVGAASPGETRIRLAVIAAGLPEPALDVDVHAPDGTPIGYTELAHPEFRLLHEYEGDHHRVDRRQWTRDIDKHAACVAAGWHVTRLTAEHAYPDPAPSVARIRDALVRAGWTP